MPNWVESVNNLSSEHPSPEELFFGSVGAWLYLYFGHRKLFGVTDDIVATVNIAFIFICGCMAYIINHYLELPSGGIVLILTYTVAFYSLYYLLIFKPVWSAQLLNTIRFVLLVIFGIAFSVIFSLCEYVAQTLLYGTVFGRPAFDPLLPRVFVVIIACIGWVAIILSLSTTKIATHVKKDSFNFNASFGNRQL
eukprot:1117142_1